MRISDKGLAEIAAHEGIVPYPYKDTVGVWTVGVGHTASAGEPNPATLPRGKAIPLSDVIAIFRRDLAEVEARVNKAVKVPLKQHEFDALVSFDFNTGGIFKAAITTHLNKGNRKAAADAFMGWLKPAEVKRRRVKEQALFRDGTYSSNGRAPVYTADASGKVNRRSGKTVNVLSLHTPTPQKKPKPSVGGEVLAHGASGPLVQALQQELARLNYHPGGLDGIFGNLTRDALLAFQADNGLATDGKAGDAVWKALKTAKSRPLMSERKDTTLKELQDKGSDIADGAVKAKKGAWAAIVAGVTTVGAKIAEHAGDLVNLPLEPFRQGFETWGPWLFGTAIVGAGVFFLWQARRVGAARVEDHREAKTL